MDNDDRSSGETAFLFDLDGTLVDSVYQHVLAWREALEAGGIQLAVWRIHRQIGMSGGLFVNALARETGRTLSTEEAEQILQVHGEAFKRYASQVRPLFCIRRFSLLTSSFSRGWTRIWQIDPCIHPRSSVAIQHEGCVARTFHSDCVASVGLIKVSTSNERNKGFIGFSFF
jgi:hypothetical protein